MKPILERRSLPADASILCIERDEPRFPFHWHCHASYELTLITAGTGQRFIGDHIGPYRPGDLVLSGSNVPHTWASSPFARGRPQRHRAIYVQFAPDVLGAEFLGRPELAAVKHLLDHAARGLQFTGSVAVSVGHRLRLLLRRRGLPRLLLWLEILDQLARTLPAATVLASAATAPPRRPTDQRRIETALGFIHDHLGEPIRLDSVAAAVHMSRSTFARFFRRTTGRTLIEYVNDVRIGRACLLLTDTDLSVSEVCFKSGFASLPYFNRRFRSGKTITPSAYRHAYSASDRRPNLIRRAERHAP